MTRILATIVLLLAIVEPLTSGTSQDGWKNLMRIRLDRGYTVLDSRGSCISGRLIAVDDSRIKLESVGQQSHTASITAIERLDVIRVCDSTFAATHDVIYSGRSSWADIKEAKPYPPVEWLKIKFQDGREKKCQKADIFGDRIMCQGETILKPEIERVYYVRLQPASSWQQYVDHEGVPWLDPRTWFNYALFGRIEVLLYDSTKPEDNTPVTCSPVSTNVR